MITRSIWNLHCTNPNCNHAYSKEGNELDVICQRCGGFVEVNEHIIIEEKKNDLRSN